MVFRGNGYCPGHITGFFSIYDHPSDPMKKGSRGSGVNLSLGALSIVALTPPDGKNDDELHLELNVHGDDEFKINEDLYKEVLMDLLPEGGKGWAVSLRVRLQLPVGQGFGMSGAGGMATSMAVWDALHSRIKIWDRRIRFGAERETYFSQGDRPQKMHEIYNTILRDRDGESRVPINYGDCVKASHKADISIMGGLGDVVAQARGGVTVRLAPGVPPYGDIHNLLLNVDKPTKVVSIIAGDPITTSSILSEKDHRERINKAGKNALRNILMSPTSDRFMKESRIFSDQSGLQTDEVREIMEIGDEADRTSMIMIGNSAFSLISGEDMKSRVKKLEGAWEGRGNIITTDIDTFGARPIY